MKRDLPEVVIDGQLDCGHNRDIPFNIQEFDGKTFVN